MGDPSRLNDASKFIYKSRVNNGFSTVLQPANDVDLCKSLPIYYVRKHIFLIHHRDHSEIHKEMVGSRPSWKGNFLKRFEVFFYCMSSLMKNYTFEDWYFVTKIVLTYCAKKMFEWLREFFET